MLIWIIFILIGSSLTLIASQLISIFAERFNRIQTKEVAKAEKQLEEMFVEVEKRKLFLYYALSPIIAGGIGFFLFRNLIVGLGGAFIGLALPTIILKVMETLRRQKFQKQLVDTLMVLSSSLKSGLSFLQAIEVVVQDMPAPISEEFSLILRENKMGVSLGQSLAKLNKKMRIEELELMTNSILVSQETGGDLTKVFTRLATTIRDNRKIQENIETLTLQGRIQGIIMLILPIAFIWWILAFNRHHFDIMLQSEKGKILLFVAAILQVIGMFLIRKFSKLRT